MRSVQDHLAAVLAAVGPVSALDVVLHDAVGCILAADVVATQDLPALSVAALDGYAVAAHDTSRSGYATEVPLPVAHDVRPGQGGALRLVPGTAVRIASGAPLPIGADAVVPLQETDRGTAKVSMQRPAVAGQHVRPAGSDVRTGQVVLEAGSSPAGPPAARPAAGGWGGLAGPPAPRRLAFSL